MASSDDEGEAVPNTVSDYSFLDVNNNPISFSELPLIWDETESMEGSIREIDLDGTTDHGLQKIFEQVTAWKFDISFAKPEIFVLSKKNNWIKLLKPRKIFEKTIRTILITVHCLHFVKRNPETSAKALWDHLSKVFSLYEPRPSENDLVDHMNLIGEAVKRDEVLAGAKVLVVFLREKPRKKKVLDEEDGSKPGFIVDEVTHEEEDDDLSDAQEEDFFEHVCAICDNGGDILCCEGRCMRSFHATVEAGSDSACDSLGFSEEQVKALANLVFECKNCQYKQHQCFVCGELGSSDKTAGAEVFQCVTGTCGYFYHPRCVAKVLKFKYGDNAKDLEAKIAAGKPFMCPLHICYKCKGLEPEDKNDLQRQFAVCRRCPTAYHRICLPREIAFEDDEDEGMVQRAWEGLMPNKILIYCLKHEIEDELATPTRNHIKFPDVDQKTKKQALEPVGRGKIGTKGRAHTSEGAAGKKIIAKQSQGTEKLPILKNPAGSSLTREGRLSIPGSSKKQKSAKNSKVALKKTYTGKQNKSTSGESKASLGAMLFALHKGSEAENAKTSDSNEQMKTGKPVGKEGNNSVILDADSKKRILSIMKDAESSLTLEEVARKHRAPSTHAYSSKYAMQAITLGKVEGSIEALHAALQKLEEGGSLEDAKAVCEPGLLNQMVKWKSKLRVYLAPFLYGMRYTSFGRHFTKVEKLQAIVNKLHWYVQDGDMVVDFCCGTNDFSCLMKEKLDKTGKSCAYKNYDIFQAKNDFNFERRDWMSVRPSELRPGSQLIMGLNPPFGVNAALANKFIDKALEFKPKLLILVVPRGTERLDQKKTPYDLVWEDDELLSGKAFYLPGSVDVNDKQMEDWNVNTPPLSLWSHPDWTAKHNEIAQQQGHLPTVGAVIQLEEHHYDRAAPACPLESRDLHHESPVLSGGHGLQDVKQLQDQVAKVTETHMEGSCNDNEVKDSIKNCGHDGNPANDNLDKGNNTSRKRRKRSEEKSSGEKRSLSRHSSPSRSGGRSLGGHLSKLPDMRSHTEQREGLQHFDRKSSSGSNLQLQRGCVSYEDDFKGRRNNYSEEFYSNSGDQRPRPTGHGSDYAFGVPDEQFMSHHRGRPNVHRYGHYMSNMNEGYGREVDMSAQVQHYGHQCPNSLNYRDDYLASAASGFSAPYKQLEPSLDSSYNSTNTSATQRYAPKLDELNPMRMNNLESAQLFRGRNDVYNPPPRAGRHISMGFASGPYRPRFPQQSSSGWLNE